MSSSSPSRYHQINKRMKSSTSSYSAASQQRGGSFSNKEEDEELDAYIEDLISTVETDSVSEAPSNHHKDKEEEGEEDEDANRILANKEEEDVFSIIERPSMETESTEKGSNAIAKQDTEDNKDGGSQKQKSKRKKKKKTSTVTKAESDEALGKTSRENSAASNARDEDISKSTAKPSTQRNNDDSTSRRRRQHPPNALYRFLLHQGAVGQVLVMFLILCMEWIYAYLPPLANFLAWLWARIFGQRVVGGDYAWYPYERDNEPIKATRTSVAAVRSRRTGQTGKQRRALTRQADEASLAQLKRIGDVQQAKYRHVSLDFMQRHGLGSFARERQDSKYLIEEVEEFKSAGEGTMKGKKVRRAKEDIVTRDQEEDVDWVIQALTSNLPKKPSGGPTVKPAVSVGVGSDGVSVGVEFSLGRRQAVIDAITSERKKKYSAGPRTSDRDGGDGIFGRLRAATGANSRVSRSLLGAYPGDAVPPDEAASVHGVADLAHKYGWGDWSDEDEDESNIVLSRRRKRRKKRRVETRRTPTIGVEFNLSSEQARPPMSSRRKGISRESIRTEELPSMLEDGGGSERRRRIRRRKSVRPALERIAEVRKKKIDNDEDVS